MAAPTPQLGAGNVTTVTATDSTYTVDKPANLADNDLLVAVPFGRNVGTWDTFPSGFVQQNVETVVGTFAVFTKAIRNAAGEAATYSWHNSGGSSRGGIVMFRVTGANIENALDVAGTAVTSGTTSSIAAPSVTPGKVDTLLIGVYNSNGPGLTGNTISTPTGMTQVDQLHITDAANFSTVAVFFQTLSTTSATGTRTATVSPAGTSGAGMLTTFNPIAEAGAALSVSARSASSSQASLGGSVGASVSAGMSVAAAGVTQYGSSDLSVKAGVTAVPQGTGFAYLDPDGNWYPITPKQMIDGTWT